MSATGKVRYTILGQDPHAGRSRMFGVFDSQAVADELAARWQRRADAISSAVTFTVRPIRPNETIERERFLGGR